MNMLRRCLIVWLLLWMVDSDYVVYSQLAPTPILISEVAYDVAGADEMAEWVELAHIGTGVVDLSGYKVGDEETAGGTEGMMRFPIGAEMSPGDVIVVAQTAVGFEALFGFAPDYEMVDSDTAVPDMRRFRSWADGEVALANDGDELLLINGQGVIVDSLSYGDSGHYFEPPIAGVLTGQSLARVPVGCDSDTAVEWQPQRVPTPGVVIFEGACNPPPIVEPEVVLPIGTVQGHDDVSPYLNRVVTVRGVVTGLYEDRNVAGVTFYTLFVQDVAGGEDGDPMTSDGIAVFSGQERPSVQIGDQLLLTGQVTEFFGLTELDDDGLAIVVEASGVPLPEPLFLYPPVDNEASQDYFEMFEGMRVAVDETAVVVGPTFSGCGLAVVQGGDERPIRRDETTAVGQVINVLHSSDVVCEAFPDVKVGDELAGLRGPLIYHFDQFKIVQQSPLTVTEAGWPPLPEGPRLAAGHYSVATFNMENYFDEVDDTGSDAEPKPTARELVVKQAKLAFVIEQLLGCPTLIGVQEVENRALLTALADLVASHCGFTYTVTHEESVDVRGIDVALLSDPRRVQVQAAELVQGCTTLRTGIVDGTVRCSGGEAPLFSRPPLKVALLIDGQRHLIFVNHFKSKRGGEIETAPRRLAQAEHLFGQVAIEVASGIPTHVIVMGDFNDYEGSATMLALGNDWLVNVVEEVPDSERYSLVFGGVAQLIDAILVSEALAKQVHSVQILHTNADYPDSLGQDITPSGLPYRATDHDIPLAIFRLEVSEMEETAVVSEVPLLPIEEESDVGSQRRWRLWWVSLVGGLIVLLIFIGWRGR